MTIALATFLEGGFPRTDSPFFNRDDPALGAFADAAAAYHRDGFITIPDLITAAEADAIVEEASGLYEPTLEDGPRSSYRVQDGWRESPAVRALASHPKVLELLEALYGRRPFPFQTLNFRTGSQQRNHSDSIHFSSLPQRFMCGVWVALEDTHHDNGPLFYVPGSHKLPQLTLADMGMTLETASYPRYEDVISEVVRAAGLDYTEVHVPRGTAFVWSSNLIHGGMPINAAGSTRHSQVTHYFFDECVHYSPVLSEVPSGELFVRTPVDVSTGQPIPPSFNGRKVRLEPTRGNLTRVHFEDAVDDAAPEIASRDVADALVARAGDGAGAAMDALLRVYQGRADLQDTFGEPDALDVNALVRWASTAGLSGDSAGVVLRGHEEALRGLAKAAGATRRSMFRR